MQGRKPLTATNLAVYQHYHCDLYIHNVYHGRTDSVYDAANTSGLTKAHFQRGIDWETSLFAWLDRSNLLLTIPSGPLEPNDLLENILADNRDHFFIAGLTFWPPHQDLDKRFALEENGSLTFGLAKPDLLEITKVKQHILWRVIDAKSSQRVTASHHIQVYFYTLCLRYLLHCSPYQSMDTAGIWLSKNEGCDIVTPSLNDIKLLSVSLLAPIFDNLLFSELPKVLRLPYHEVKWHYNPLCHGCHYEPECRLRALNNGEIGSMPNISRDDAKVLQDLLRICRVSSPFRSEKQLPDIEELHDLFSDHTKVDLLPASSSAIRRAKQILAIPKKAASGRITMSSPIIEASRSQEIQVIPRRNYTCPNKEGTAIIISTVSDPCSPNGGGDCFTVTTHSGGVPAPHSAFICSSDELVSKLANLIRTIQSSHSFSAANTCQFYIWSSAELAALQSTIIQAALASTSSSEDVQLCIGALSQGASLLRTNFQPLLLSGALLSFLSGAKRTKVEYKVCLERMGLSTEGTSQTLRKRIDNELRRLRGSGASQPPGCEGHERGLAQLPKVVVLKKEIERQLALPIPGYWDLPQCARLFLPLEGPCPSSEQIFEAYKTLSNDGALEKLLIHRNRLVYQVLRAFRARATSANGTSYLVNEANMLSVSFMDICKEKHLRKLFFMQQFEILARLTELWQARIDGCPDAPVIQYCDAVQGSHGPEYIFRLISGSIDVPASEKNCPLFDKLLVEDVRSSVGEEDHIPVEALFDDLGVSGLIFPLSRTTESKWTEQDERVQRQLWVADVRNAYLTTDRQHTMVTLRVWGTGRTMFRGGETYRLSPRLVDFNTTKVLSTLLETDILWDSRSNGSQADGLHRNIPFLQLIMDPNSFGRLHMAEQYLKMENEIHKLLYDLRDLGNTSAASLVLGASQHAAAQQILSNRLSIIWGPPGTGKTHTIALSLLRLIAVEHRVHGPQAKIVFITALTNAAVNACHTKLVHLMKCYRSILSLSQSWLDDIEVQIVSRGDNHRLSSRVGPYVHIYVGTIYQLYNFAKRHSINVDCLIVDEAGQIPLSSVSLVIRSLRTHGRIVIAGDPEQLGPILNANYAALKLQTLFGSVLDCLMNLNLVRDKMALILSSIRGDVEDDDQQVVPLTRGMSTGVIQLVENFRLNSDLCDCISTIYLHQLKPEKVQERKLAEALTLSRETQGLLPPNLKELAFPIQAFLVGLSDVMLKKEGENGLMAPTIHLAEKVVQVDGALASTSTYRTVSLSLIRLRSWSKRLSIIPYETHIDIEAAVAVAIVHFLQTYCPDDDIFVATPYRIQREAVKRMLAKTTTHKESLQDAFGRLDLGGNKTKRKVTVDTIERLQGSEAAFVLCLFSMPKASTPDFDFLLNRRRLNVAFSRAKSLCILISSDEMFCPPAKILANEETARGYAFFKAFQQRAWSYYLPVQAEKVL